VIRSIAVLSAALWWGSLSTIGFVVVPLLFTRMQTKQMAGQMAALLFQYQAYVSWICTGLLLMIAFKNARKLGESFKFTQNGMLVAGLLFSLTLYFVVAPQIAARQNLKLWHALGTALFAGQWMCATAVVWRQNRA
jgi:Domain of unknown function (DUF4149)